MAAGNSQVLNLAKDDPVEIAKDTDRDITADFKDEEITIELTANDVEDVMEMNVELERILDLQVCVWYIIIT